MPYSLLCEWEIYFYVTILSLKFIHIWLTWTLHKCNTSEIRYYCCVRDINLVICFSFNFIIYLLFDLKTMLWSTILLPIFIIRERNFCNFFLLLKINNRDERKKLWYSSWALWEKNILNNYGYREEEIFIINFQSYLRQWFLLKWCAFFEFCHLLSSTNAYFFFVQLNFVVVVPLIY